MGDIENFKKVNDAFGHPIGDEILKIFASVLADTVQAAGSVARYGGEEFAVILPGIELEDAKQLAERMRLELEGKKLAVNKSGTEIGKITASFGIAQLSVGEDCPEAGAAGRYQALRGQVRRAQPGGCRRARGRILTAGTVGLNHCPGFLFARAPARLAKALLFWPEHIHDPQRLPSRRAGTTPARRAR